MPYLNPAIYGYTRQSTNTIGPEPTMSIVPVLSGRSRYRLRNPDSVILTQLSYEWNDNLLYQFRNFWNVDLNYGTNWFDVDLQLGTSTTPVGLPDIKLYSAHALAGFTVSSVRNQRWEVSMDIEVRPVPI